MKTTKLYIITCVLKPSIMPVLYSAPGDPFNSHTASEKLYETEQEAVDAIEKLKEGIYQVQTVYVNQS